MVELRELPSNEADLQARIVCLLAEKEELSNQFLDLTKRHQQLSEVQQKLVEEKLSVEDENQKLILYIARLEEQLKILREKHFGKSSEKVKGQINDLEHHVEDTEISLGLDIGNSSGEKNKTKQKPRRQKIPKSVPREDIIVNAPNKCRDCGEEDLRKIGEDVSEVLEYVPASFKVLRYIRPRLVCKKCEAMNQAYPVSKGIDKGKAGFGLLAHIMVQKYCNHLPLYRQSAIYERESSIIIPRSTMSGWLRQCCVLLNPLVEELRRTIFRADKLHADDTPIKVLDFGGTKTKTGRIWVYVLDKRPCGDKTPPAVCYYYTPDRKGERPESHLKNFKGVLQADAYAGYNGVYITEDHPDRKVYEACCWAHLRRKFYEITVASDNTKIAHEVIEQIRKLYEIETKIRGKPPPERLKARQKHSKKLVTELFDGFKKVLGKLSQKGATAKAVNYALNNEQAFKRFLDDGKIEIDNNAAERALRSVAVGRKNWLFAGSDKGGEVAANIYSLIETAKLNDINPWLYLKKVLSVIQDHNSQKLVELLPWNIQLE